MIGLRERPRYRLQLNREVDLNPNFITAFLSKYSPVTHAIAGVMVFLIGAYAEVPQFKAFVDSDAGHLPHWLAGAIGAGVAVYLHYKNGEKKA